MLKGVYMTKKILVVWACAAFILVLIGIKMREYKREFIFERSLLHKLAVIEQKQDTILKQLSTNRGFAQQPQAFQPPAIDLNKIYQISAGQTPVKGDPNGKVTIVEFSDFQCPFSQKFHPMAIDVVNSYPVGVKYILKNFPLGFHAQAKPAAKALWAANEQGKYWEMMDLLVKKTNEVKEGKFKELAVQLGMDANRFEKDLKEKDAQWEKLIEEDLTAGKEAEVMGTPTFYINGKRTEARTVEEFKKEIDQLLK